MTEFRTIQQVADYFGVHYRTVKAWVDSGQLRAIRVGRLYRIPEADLMEFAGKRNGEVPEAPVAPERERPTADEVAAVKRVLEYLEEEAELQAV